MIEIPLSKRGKYAGIYVALVDDEDKDLAELSWKICSIKRKYVVRKQLKDSRTIYLHRIIMERMIAPLKIENGQQVDHRDGNVLNNTRANLRLATTSQNQSNRRKTKKNTSGYKGVSRDGRNPEKWIAQVKHEGKSFRLGSYDTPEEAYQVYCEKAKELFGEFFNLG